MAAIKVARETWLGADGKPEPLEPPFQNGSPRPWGFDPYFNIEAIKALKGEPPRQLRLFSENSTGRFWLDVGTRHVLFITEEKFDEPIGQSLTMDTPDNSIPILKAIKLLRALETLSKSK